MRKTYSIPLHRKIASSELIKTDIEDSYFNLTVENNKEIDVNTSFESLIYNIDKDEDKVIIYSNTLNINITDKFSGLTPLYYLIIFNNEESVDLFTKERKEYLIEKRGNSFFVYFNKKDKENVPQSLRLNLIGNPLTRSSNVKVRKLKNRFKITVNNIDTKGVSIELGSRFLFEPIVYGNYIEIPEFITYYNKKLYYGYNNSFNKVLKKELKNKEQEYKDPIISTIPDENYLCYYSWRSNLLFDEKISDTFYYYLKTDSYNNTNIIYQKTSKIRELEDLVYMFSTNKSNSNYKMNINPYLQVENKIPLGENFTVLYREAIDSKYSSYNNTKLGTNSLILDFDKVYNNRLVYLERDGYNLYQEEVPSFSLEISEKSTEDLPNFFRNNIEDLKQKMRRRGV